MSLPEIILYVALGLIGGLALVVHAARKPVTERTDVYSTTLVVVSFIYVAFAMAAMEDTWLVVEIGGVLLFAGVAFLGRRRSPWWLAVGWFAHIVWDVALHIALDVHFVPLWYPVACIGFDLVVGVSIRRALVISQAPTEAIA